MTVFFNIEVEGETIWDGQAPAVPQRGDLIRVNCGRTYRVEDVVWQPAEEVLGKQACETWNVGESDLCCVTLLCRRRD